MKTITATLLTTLVILAMAAPAAADPGAPGWTTTDRARIERLLAARHHVPGKGELKLMHPAAHEILLDIVRFPSSRRAFAHTRALAALRHFPGRSTAAALAGVIKAADQRARQVKPGPDGQLSMSLDLVDLRQALTSYAVVQGPASVTLSRAYLAFPNQDVRATAAVALGHVRTPAARAALLARQKVERSALVKHEIARELKRKPRANKK